MFNRYFRISLIPIIFLFLLWVEPFHAQTNYDGPDWAKKVVWYQIFPERFRNGDPYNDPTADRIGAPDDWKISPWTGDWYQRAAWEQRVGPQFQDFVNMRRYGGDLQGVIDKLDYLKEMGITAIYLNPVFDAVSLHKYDASYYRHIDRFFGPDPGGDVKLMKSENPTDPSTWKWTSADKLFLKLLRESHRRGMYVIIDGVFNHTGQDFWAFRDLKKNQRNSLYKNWYDVISYDNPATPDTNEFDFHGWWGFKGLPEFKEQNRNLVKPVREHIFQITRRWMDPNGDGDPSDGVDGWRLDVVQEVGHEFWKQWNALVQSINPKAYTTAEIWDRDAKNYINGKEFTAVMNYRFASAVQDFMIDQSISAGQFLDSLKTIRDDYPEEANLEVQNLMDSHDTPRLASMIVNPGRAYDRNGKPSQGFNIRKPNKAERKIQKLIALFQFTYVGAPMIYYGDEAGMWGADDPSDRKPMVWADLKYDDEINHPFSKPRARDDNNFDRDLFNWYKKLAHIRASETALQTGQFIRLKTNDKSGTVVFMRRNNNRDFDIIIINRSEFLQKISFNVPESLPLSGRLHNLLDDSTVEIGKSRQITVRMEPVSGRILTNE